MLLPQMLPTVVVFLSKPHTTNIFIFQVNLNLLVLSQFYSSSTSFHFASAAVAVDSSRITASSSASWSRFSPPSNSVNGRVSTTWFMVWRWSQSQEGDWAETPFVQIPQKDLRGQVAQVFYRPDAVPVSQVCQTTSGNSKHLASSFLHALPDFGGKVCY